MFIEDGCHLIVFEGLVLHHVAPVAGRIANRQEDGLIFFARPLKGFGRSWVPVYRISGMLTQVGAGFVDESVEFCATIRGQFVDNALRWKGFTHGMTHVLFREATSQTEQARGSETQEEKFFHELQRAAD